MLVRSRGRLTQHGIEFGARGAVVVAVDAQRQLADLLDAVEDLRAFLFAHGVAEQAAKQADVLAQRLVLVGGNGVRFGHHLRPCRSLRLSSMALSR
jgi:hypothetical protein